MVESIPLRAPHTDSDRRLIETALGHVLAHPDFRASARLSAFLRFIVAETLDGRSDRLKAFSIAVTVYGRDDSFDPQASSIVRVEATRLRRMLERHFREDGRDLAVAIRIPKGRYVPEFVRLVPETSVLGSAPPGIAPVAGPAPAVAGRSLRPAAFAGIAILLLAGIVAAGALFRFGDAPSPPGKTGPTSVAPGAAMASDVLMPPEPTVAVQIRDTPEDPALRRAAGRIKDAMEHEFERADDIAIIERIGDGAAQVEYRVDLALEPAHDNVGILRVRVTHVASAELIWSRTLRDFPLDPQTAEQDRRAAEIGLAIAQPYGLIFTDYRGRYRQDNGARRPFSCVIRAFDYLQDPTAQSFAETMGCLDTALAARPDFASAAALRAVLIADDYVTRIGTSEPALSLDDALTMARRAVAVDPQRTRSYLALAMVQFLSGNLPGYERNIGLAIELNPGDAHALAQQGAAQVLSGKSEQGARFLAMAAAQNEVLRDTYAFYFFLAALMRDDPGGVQNWGRAASASRHPVALLASIVAAHRRGDIAARQDWSDRLQKSFPAFARDLRGGLERMGMADKVAERLMGELADAGVEATANK